MAYRAIGLVLIAIGCLGLPSDTAANERQRPDVTLEYVGGTGRIPNSSRTRAIFRDWAYGRGTPVVCRITSEPDTAFQAFIGLTEAYWNEPGKRLVDIVIQGQCVDTVDTFEAGKNVPFGRIFPVESNAEGEIIITIAPNNDAPDKNPALCGILLFDGAVDLDIAAIIANKGPTPLVTVNCGPPPILTDEQIRNRGKYFPKKSYVPEPLPIYQEVKDRLPSPIYDEHPDYVACYWKAWELAFQHFRKPPAGSPFVSNYIDEAFNPSLFLWDTAFMTMFCNYAHPYVPGIQSLDNFYCTQLEDGEIVREVSEETGMPHPTASQPGTPHSLNHPILAWAEREAYRITADRQRVAMVYESLVRYYGAYEKIRDPASGFYLGTWASMDNSPRIKGMLCSIDTTSEMVLFARDLAFFARLLGRTDEAETFEAQADALTERINEHLWDDRTGFYYDWAKDGKRHNVRTIAGFWPLLARIADADRQARLIAHLTDENKFGRLHRVPTVPADEQGYSPTGNYWRGAVWAPTNMMVIRGLQRCGHDRLAHDIAMNHLGHVVEVFRNTGTLWENYMPDSIEPGQMRGHRIRGDFVGWTGLPAICGLIEFAIGIDIDAPANRLTWTIASPKRVGIRNLWFGGNTVSLICQAPGPNGERPITIESQRPFELELVCGDVSRTFDIDEGRTSITVPMRQ